MGITLPVNPSTSSASVGKDFLMDINTGTAAVPVWTEVGGQRSSDLNRSADSIDVSHKTSGGWKATKPGLRGWGIDLSALILLSDLALPYMEKAFNDGAELNVRLRFPDGTVVTGWGGLTDFSMSNPHDGEATLSGTLEGDGELSDRTPQMTPYTGTVSKADPDDIAYSITPTSTTVSSVKIDGVAQVITTDYTYSSGTLTLLSTTLGELTIGAHTVTVTTGDGAVISRNFDVTA